MIFRKIGLITKNNLHYRNITNAGANEVCLEEIDYAKI